MLEMGGIQLPPRPLSDFSFITVVPELLPVTYPRCCSLISCPDYLARITDKQANRFLLLQCSVFFPLHMCVYARVFSACTPQKSWWLPFLGCVCGTLVSSAVHTAALALTVPLTQMQREQNTNQHLLLVLFFFSTEHIRDGVTEPCGRSVAKEEHSSQGVCAERFLYPLPHLG